MRLTDRWHVFCWRWGTARVSRLSNYASEEQEREYLSRFEIELDNWVGFQWPRVDCNSVVVLVTEVVL